MHRRPLLPDAGDLFSRVRGEGQVDLAGTALLWFEDPERIEVPLILIRREEAGFWANHHCTTLRVGQVVEFCDIWGEGKAQVISTEQKEGYIESRFWILSEG